jgi:hypothetical protein
VLPAPKDKARPSADSKSSRKDAVRRALKGEAVSHDPRDSGERAFLVGLDSRVRLRTAGKRSLTAGAQAARDAATSVAAGVRAPSIPEFSAQESLDELRSLATSAVAAVVGEV